jgi:hypothetical protein
MTELLITTIVRTSNPIKRHCSCFIIYKQQTSLNPNYTNTSLNKNAKIMQVILKNKTSVFSMSMPRTKLQTLFLNDFS